MKQVYLFAVSAMLICACNEKEVIDAECDINDMDRCVDDYHYKQCHEDGLVIQGCCSDEAIAAGNCLQFCMMRESGAVCEPAASPVVPDKCGNARLDEGEECDKAVPVGMTCSDVIRGTSGTLACSSTCEIDASGCHVPKAGERCDVAGALNNGGCDEKGRYFYCEEGITHVEDCATRGGVCGVFPKSERVWQAGCVDRRDTCETVGEIRRRCAIDMFDTGSAYKTALHICAHDAISGQNYWILADDPRLEYCPDTCIWETGTCGRLTSDENTACDAKTYEAHCEGSIAVSCRSSGRVEAYDCANFGSECVISGTSAKPNAVCVQPDTARCDDPELYRKTCVGNQSVTMACTPVVGTQDYFYNITANEACTNGCDPDTGKCFKLNDTEGTRCTDTYKNRCIAEDALLYCNEDKKISARVCVDALGQTGYCVEDDGRASCADPCDEPGKTRSQCYDDETSNRSYTVIETCTDIDGHRVFVETAREHCLYCQNDYAACAHFHETDGEPCDEDSPDFCDGNTLSLCDTKYGTRVSYSCAMYGYVCISLMKEDGWVNNITSCESPCHYEGEEISTCGVNDEYTAYETLTTICMESSNGKLFQNYKSRETCKFGCNETGDACATSKPTCTSDGKIYRMCYEDSSGEWLSLYGTSCKEGGYDYLFDEEGEYVYEWCPEGCNEEDGTCNKVFDTQGDSCDVTTFEDQCIREGDKFYVYCANSGHIAGVPCSGEERCHHMKALGEAACAEPCTETKVEQECGEADMGGDTIGEVEFITVCEDVGSGQLFGTTAYRWCEHGCNAAGTACAEAPDGT